MILGHYSLIADISFIADISLTALQCAGVIFPRHLARDHHGHWSQTYLHMFGLVQENFHYLL